MTAGQANRQTPTRAPDFVRYLNVQSAYGISFAPDGRHLTFLTNITDVSEVWRIRLPTGAGEETPSWPTQLTFGGERIVGAAYSPVADQLIVGGDVGGNERTQLWLMSGDSATFKPLTSQPEAIHIFGGWQEDGAASSGWSPDGKRIVYANNGRDPRFFDIFERSVDDLESPPRLLLQGDGSNYPVRYSPDGRMVLVERADSNIRNALLLVDVATGESRELTSDVSEGPARHTFPSWSLDGHGLYLLSDRGRQFLSPAWIDLASGEMTYLREDQWDAESLVLSPDRRRMALVTNVDGVSHIELFDVSAGWEGRTQLPSPTLPQGIVMGSQWSPDGRRLAFAFSPPDDAMDIWMWDVESQTLRCVTKSSRGALPDSAFVAPQLVRYPTFDGRQIPAYLYRPRGVAGANLPVVVFVHGGPEGQARPDFDPVCQYLVASGYAVLTPNVRGSTGYGYLYQSLDDVRLRMDSVADLEATVRWLIDQGTADPRRIAVMGGSYGGFMVLAALTTYPDLWATGVDIVGVANFVTLLSSRVPDVSAA
jgi:dipeptidyl aminopeptidase/acylaminoacyl peptidase